MKSTNLKTRSRISLVVLVDSSLTVHHIMNTTLTKHMEPTLTIVTKIYAKGCSYHLLVDIFTLCTKSFSPRSLLVCRTTFLTQNGHDSGARKTFDYKVAYNGVLRVKQQRSLS